MKKNKKLTKSKNHKHANETNSKRRELIIIVSQLVITTVILSLIALYAANAGIQSHDFWELLRSAVTFQSTLQGVRMLIAISK